MHDQRPLLAPDDEPIEEEEPNEEVDGLELPDSHRASDWESRGDLRSKSPELVPYSQFIANQRNAAQRKDAETRNPEPLIQLESSTV